MFIVEGTDLVGKTTVAKKVAEKLGYTYQHLPRLPDLHDRCWDYIAMASPHTVRDRFHMSEWAYSRARQDGSDNLLTLPRVKFVDGHLRLIPTYTVVILAQRELIKKRWTDHQDREMYDVDVILRANDQFDTLIQDDTFDWHRFVWCTESKPWVLDEQIEGWLEEYVKLRQATRQLYMEKYPCL